MVLFWTTPVDTPSARAEAMAELRATAAWAAASSGYQFRCTPPGPMACWCARRAGRRSWIPGLDYPFGFVLVDRDIEQFMTGIISEDDLRDALVDYFDPRGRFLGVFRTGWPSSTAGLTPGASGWHHPRSRLTPECRTRRCRSDSRS